MPQVTLSLPHPCLRGAGQGGREGGRPSAPCVSAVFTGSGDACARAFDAQSGELRRVFRGHTFIINCIQVGPSAFLRAAARGREGAPPRSINAGGRVPPPTASPVMSAPAPAGARPGALHRLARRRPAPLGRARAPRCPAAPSAHAQPLTPLQQQGGLRRHTPAAGLTTRAGTAQTPIGSQSALLCSPRRWRPMAGEERGSPGGRRARRRRLVFLWWPGGAGSGSARPRDRPLFPFRVTPALPPHP